MKIYEVLELNERNKAEVVKDYNGLRTMISNMLKAKKDINAVTSFIRQWLGGLDDLNSVKELVGSLGNNPNFKNDAIDKAIIKVANSILAGKLESDENKKAINQKVADREERMKTVIPKGKTLSTGI